MNPHEALEHARGQKSVGRMNLSAQQLGRLAKGVPKRISNKERLRRRRAMEKINANKRQQTAPNR